jgi:sarcosine oxidase
MQDSIYDVAVIGVGAMGSAALYQLAKRGVKVVGIDSFAPPHDQGSSHGDTRITRQAVGEGPAYAPLVMRSQTLWREMEAMTGVRLFEACGVLVMNSSASTTSHHGMSNFTQSTIDVARAYGIEHEVLNAQQIRARFPQFGPVPDNTIGYYEPGGGYVKPELCIQTQIALAVSHGAGLQTGVTVTGLDSRAGEVTIGTTGGQIRARKVIVSAGMWSAQLLGAPFDRLLKVYRQKLYWFKLQQPSIFPHASPSFIRFHGPAEADACYGFPPLPGENSMKIATEQYEVAVAPDGLARDVSAEESDAMFRHHVLGQMEGVSSEVLKTAVCAYTVTPDSGFIIDQHPRLANVTVVSACSGHGFKHSAAIGEALAQQQTGERCGFDFTAFSISRFE